MNALLLQITTANLGSEIVDFFFNIFYTVNGQERWTLGALGGFHSWFHIVSELLVWVTCVAIPILLFRIIRKHTDLPFPKIVVLFSAFILFCGATHFLNALAFWWPAYRLNTLLTFFTGLLSVASVFALYKIVPVILTLKTARQLEEEIEQRKAAEEEAKEAYKKVDKILAASLDIICTISEDGVFETVSKASHRVLGYEPAELIGRNRLDFVHPDDKESTINCQKRLFSRTNIEDFVNRYQKKDGSWIYISWKATLSEDGKTCYAVARDISQRVKNEQLKEKLNDALLAKIEQLKEQDKTIEKIREFQFMADSIPQIIWTARPDGNMDYYNRHWHEYTGMSLDQSKDWGWVPVVHPDDVRLCINRWTDSVISGKPYEIEYRFKRASDGVYRWHLGRAVPMHDENGEIVKWFGSCTDIDEYKRALDLENKLTQYEDFNRMVAHNLRGPAGSIDTLLTMVVEAEGEERDKMFRMLQDTSKSLNSTLDDLMKVLEIRLSKHIQKDECDLDEIIDSVEKMLKGEIVSKNASIVRELKTPAVMFPKVYLESIVYNMISNSLKYSRDAVPPEIRISSYSSADKTVVKFKDNGLGIDLESYGRHVFKLNKTFHRGFNSKGVGLFMTKTQIEAFGGSISVLSEVDKGTEFIVVLPQNS